MTYWKQYREAGREAFEITAEKARETLDGYWKEETLDDIFQNGRSFRLYTPFSVVWTETDDGLIPIAGFYGIIG